MFIIRAKYKNSENYTTFYMHNAGYEMQYYFGVLGTTRFDSIEKAIDTFSKHMSEIYGMEDIDTSTIEVAEVVLNKVVDIDIKQLKKEGY